MAASHPRPILPLFSKTLLVSLLFHLSAITLFSIVIYFPKQSYHYRKLAFLEEPEVVEPDMTNPLVAALTGPRRTPEASSFSLPQIDERPEGDKLRVQGHSFYEDVPEQKMDSWQRFGIGIQQVRSSLLELAGLPPLRVPGEEGKATAVEAAMLDLGPGLRVSLDWGGNIPRELISPPAVFFRNTPPSEAVEIAVSIDASGTVSSAVPLSNERPPFVEEVVEYLKRCRFAATEGSVRATTLNVVLTPVAQEEAP